MHDFFAQAKLILAHTGCKAILYADKEKYKPKGFSERSIYTMYRSLDKHLGHHKCSPLYQNILTHELYYLYFLLIS